MFKIFHPIDNLFLYNKIIYNNKFLFKKFEYTIRV